MATVQRVEKLLKRGNVRRLCRLLKDRDVVVRRRTAQALGELGDERGVSCLSKMMKRAVDEYVLRWSIHSLQTIGTPDAVNALTNAAFSTSQRISHLAHQALSQVDNSQAKTAYQLYDVLFRNDWDALASMGDTVQQPLKIVLQSDQYHAWPSGKRKQILKIATQLDVKPTQHSREMSNMGLFVGGVHTIGDLLRGLRHRTPEVRIAAAEKLALSGQQWTTELLYRRFLRELKNQEERSAAIAIARSMTQLDDMRALNYYVKDLYHPEGKKATEAAHALAEIGSPEAVQALFAFVADPPPPPAYRNVPMTLSALVSVGPAAVDSLHAQFKKDDPAIQRLLVEIVTRTDHTNSIELLQQLTQKGDEDIRRSALDSLAALNSREAAQALMTLVDANPDDWIIRALASITHPEGAKQLRKLVPNLTSLQGIVLDSERQPAGDVFVQVVKEYYFGEDRGWGWLAASARDVTDEKGRFSLSLLPSEEPARLQLKVNFPPSRMGDEHETFTTDLDINDGRQNQIQVRLDRFFNRLVITHIQEEIFP